MDDEELQALRAEGLEPDNPAIIAAIDMVRWDLSSISNCMTRQARPHDGETECYTGKVAEVVFDCFGDFEGFVLETCGDRHAFNSRECGIKELALRACKEWLLITVCVTRHHNEKIQEIIVRCGCM